MTFVAISVTSHLTGASGCISSLTLQIILMGGLLRSALITLGVVITGDGHGYWPCLDQA